MAGDPKALPCLEIEISRLDRLCLHEFEARFVGLERGTIVLQLVERLGENSQRMRATLRGPRQLIAVKRGKGGFARQVRAARIPVGGLSRLQPQRAVIRRYRKRTAEGLEGGDEVAGRQLAARRLDEAVDPETLLLVGQNEIRLYIARLLKEVVRDEVKARRCPDVGFARGGFDDLAGEGPRERVQLVEVGLEEAPLHLWIVGEGPAGAVGDAGTLALVERYVLLGAQIEAEIVGIIGNLDPAFRLGRCDRHPQGNECEEKSGKTEKRAHRQKSPRRWPLRLYITLSTFAGRCQSRKRRVQGTPYGCAAPVVP